MSDIVINTAAAEDTIGYIEANPQEHQQSEWRCETGMCFAGHLALRNGAQWCHPLNPTSAMVITPDGRVTHASDYATEVLTGVKVADGGRAFGEVYSVVQPLFSSVNTVEDIKQGVKILASGQRITTEYETDEDEDGDGYVRARRLIGSGVPL